MLLSDCIALRQRTPEDRNGVFKVLNRQFLTLTIYSEQTENELNLPFSHARVSMKPSLFRSIMSATGIMGYYNPFTAEAQYNPKLPDSELAFTLLHEHAHQIGFAREEEASFVAYLNGKTSKSAELQYGARYFALKSVLQAIYPADPEFVKHMLKRYPPAMQRDRLYEKAFFQRNQGPLNAFFQRINDLFLKTNQQDGSISYSYFTDLLLRYELGVKTKRTAFATRFQKHK